MIELLIASGISAYILGVAIVGHLLARKLKLADTEDAYMVGLVSLAWPVVLAMLPFIAVIAGVGWLFMNLWQE